MQAKPQKIIKLANRSRKNRVFIDQLIRMLAVELHLGSDELNRFHLMPFYVCHSVLDERGLRGINVCITDDHCVLDANRVDEYARNLFWSQGYHMDTAYFVIEGYLYKRNRQDYI